MKDSPLAQLAAGLLQIASVAMPDTYFRTDSRCQLARRVLLNLGHDPENYQDIKTEGGVTLEEAKDILGDSVEADGLFDLGWYLGYTNGDDEAVLDGSFTAQQLRAIATYMDANTREEVA